VAIAVSASKPSRVEAPSSARGTQRIPGLDGLRAISILLVLVGHLAGTRHFLSLEVVSRFGDLGNLGVRVFFVISGYLITGLLLKEMVATRTITLAGFYYRRTLRIIPAFYVFLIVIGVLSGLGVLRLRPGDLLHAASYTINYHYDRAWWVGHLWSLSVEEQFYLLWPATLLLLGVRRAICCAAGLIIVAPLIRLTLLIYFPALHDSIGESFPTIADSIATGCVLAALGPRLLDRPIIRESISSKWFALMPSLAFFLNMKAGGRLAIGLFESMINLSIGLCVLRVSSIEVGIVSRFLNSRPATRLGVLSYSIYLWQQPFLNRHSAAMPNMFPMNIALLGVCAVVSYYFVEKPFLAYRPRALMPVHMPRSQATTLAAFSVGVVPGGE
jgi:peptidoglycan/LPS O-acetylase OafA/YrhL